MKRIENKENSPISEAGNPELTEREMEVLELAGHGFSQKEIAERLFLSTKTVDKHIENIKKKFNINKSTEIIGVYTCIKKSKKFDVELLRQYGLQIFFILINLCDGGIPRSNTVEYPEYEETHNTCTAKTGCHKHVWNVTYPAKVVGKSGHVVDKKACYVCHIPLA